MSRKSLDVELDAATALAQRIGLGSVEPVILKLAKHTTVRLAPHPLVARIQSDESGDCAYSKACRELTLASHLASCSAPAARPAIQAGGPHVENDCVITLWEFAAGRAATAKDGIAAARALKAVHDGLDELPCELPSYSDAVESFERILSDGHSLSALDLSDRLFIERLYWDRRRELSHSRPALRPLHGDAHLGNVLMTDAGPMWIDLEAICLGPLEWDVVSLPANARSEFPQIDDDLVRVLTDLRSLCVTTWCLADLDRSPEIGSAAKHHLNVLKSRFA